jgi:hypothetical protein
MEPPASPSPISIEARLVHADGGRRVVEVSAWQKGLCLARCLGEADNAEAAEDRARDRLAPHLSAALSQPPGAPQASPVAMPVPTMAGEPPPRPKAAPPQRIATTSPAADLTPDDSPAPAPADPQLPLLHLNTGTPEPAPAAADAPVDPEDWSEELAELDVQLQRLGWDRSQEGTYLQRAFAHPSRNRLTAYADLVAYLRALRGLASGSSPESAPVPLRRRDLLSQCDQLLASLGWDPHQGRQLLERSFQVSSRQQLSDDQLLAFNMLLESELIGCGSGPAAAASPG